jgi:sugar (pentulose or hexulose) kinase
MKEDQYILGIDLGTGGVKTLLFNSDLAMVAKAFEPCETYYPHSGWAEQNPDDWWVALRKTISRILTESKIKAGDIGVIGIDSMTPVMVPVDSAGNAIRPALIWMDRRATKACQYIDRQIRNDLFQISGNHNDPSNFGPKAMWFRDNEPDAYKKTAVLHHANGYLISKIAGVNTLDKTQCGLSQLCDTRTAAWSDALITGCRLDRKKFPEIFESTDIVGAVTAAAAKDLGLAEGTPLIAGSMDNVAAGLGLGIRRNGELYLSGGTATNVCLCIDQPLFNPAFHIYSHIIPNTWLSVAGVDFGGAGLRWFKEILENASFAELDNIVTKNREDLSKPLIFLPYMVGQRAPIWNDHTRGVLFGLHPSMGRGELSRTFMEGNAMGVKRILGLFEDLGHKISSAKLTGGAAESAVYSQIFSDVIGHPLEIVGEKDVATLGIAMAAAFGAKIYSSFEEMTSKVKTMKVIEPCQRTLNYYKDLQEIFIDLYEKLEPEYQRLAQIKNKYANI